MELVSMSLLCCLTMRCTSSPRKQSLSLSTKRISQNSLKTRIRESKSHTREQRRFITRMIWSCWQGQLQVITSIRKTQTGFTNTVLRARLCLGDTMRYVFGWSLAFFSCLSLLHLRPLFCLPIWPLCSPKQFTTLSLPTFSIPDGFMNS